jgi:hypothetical protein
MAKLATSEMIFSTEFYAYMTWFYFEY